MAAPAPQVAKPSSAAARAKSAAGSGAAGAAPSPALAEAAKSAGSYQAGRAVVSPNSPAAQVQVGPPIPGAGRAAQQFREMEAMTVTRTALGGQLADRRSDFERKMRAQVCNEGSRAAATPKGSWLQMDLGFGSAGPVAGASLPSDLQSYLGVSPQSKLTLVSDLPASPVAFEVVGSQDSRAGKIVVLSGQTRIQHTLNGGNRSVTLTDVVKLQVTMMCGLGTQAGAMGAVESMVADPKSSAVAAINAAYRSTDLDGVGAAP